MMQLNEWSVLLLLLKLASYFSTATLAGTLLIRFMSARCNIEQKQATSFYQYLKRYQITCLAIGSISVLLQVPIEAGSMAESGFVGIFDPFMLEMTWESVIGEQAAVRIPVFIVALIVTFMWNVETKSHFSSYSNNLIMLITLCIMAYTFTFTGHSAGENNLIKIILIFHLLVVASWAGSLLPLYKTCTLLPVRDVKRLMHYFGKLAIGIVFILIISGLTLLWKYLHSFSTLFTSSYGQLILLKLLLVSLMLLLGALHKFLLVPKITEKKHVDKLKLSIGVEIFIVFFVLIITGIFTTFVGPPN
ncbi:CopD family protein [Psychromonas sp. SP041]|uniref:copper resistance D family protein n=1 Tax=Psychromonas sp. SP041 TaxID=1365007 RepID=UPI001F10475C|nr:CopD family protein [Psychromonas sp. SP041]